MRIEYKYVIILNADCMIKMCTDWSPYYKKKDRDKFLEIFCFKHLTKKWIAQLW